MILAPFLWQRPSSLPLVASTKYRPDRRNRQITTDRSPLTLMTQPSPSVTGSASRRQSVHPCNTKPIRKPPGHPPPTRGHGPPTCQRHITNGHSRNLPKCCHGQATVIIHQPVMLPSAEYGRLNSPSPDAPIAGRSLIPSMSTIARLVEPCPVSSAKPHPRHAIIRRKKLDLRKIAVSNKSHDTTGALRMKCGMMVEPDR